MTPQIESLISSVSKQIDTTRYDNSDNYKLHFAKLTPKEQREIIDNLISEALIKANQESIRIQQYRHTRNKFGT